MAKPKPSKSSAPAQAAPPPPPSWPVFKPPLPVVELYPELHPATSNIVLLSSFFPRSLCRDYVAFLKTLPLQTTPSRPKKGEAVRVNDRFQIDNPAFALRLWETTGLKEVILENETIKDLWYINSSTKHTICALLIRSLQPLQGRRASRPQPKHSHLPLLQGPVL